MKRTMPSTTPPNARSTGPGGLKDGCFRAMPGVAAPAESISRSRSRTVRIRLNASPVSVTPKRRSISIVKVTHCSESICRSSCGLVSSVSLRSG